MSKFIQVKNKIATLEQGSFQTLCNEFLKREYNNDLQSPGSVDYNEKTRKGRPDTYLHESTGRYILCEFTTQDNSNANQFAAKLRKDLEDCLNFAALKIAQSDVELIVIGCNSSVQISLDKELRGMLPDGVALRIIGIETLSTYFSREGKLFARDFLNIPYDTGQILTKADFLKRYSVKDMATPLDNHLYGREKELTAMVSAIGDAGLIVLSGAAGTGKTRLAMEAIDLFVEKNDAYKSYYVFDKTGSISDDLLTYLTAPGNYILLVDDGNRQVDNLLSIIQQASEGGAIIKTIITVRDYAREEVMKLLRGYQVSPLYLDVLQDDTIEQILLHAPFNLSLSSAIAKITQVSKGNPRLAVMAAKVFNQHQTMESISDVSLIYHDYFQSIIDDQQVFNDSSARKVMGLLAFFKTIDIKDAGERLLLSSFDIDADEFFIVAEQLEIMELVDIYDKSVVRISEQILATYYFYLTFLKDRNISFELLINQYFASQYYRFRDAILPVLNAFDANTIISSVSNILLDYFDAVQSVSGIALQFLELFGDYFPDQAFSYINSLIQAKSAGKQVLIPATFGQQEDVVVNILSKFFKTDNPNLLTAIELGIRYCRDDESATKALIESLKQTFYPTDIDLLENFTRQLQLIDCVKASKDFISMQIFYTALPHIILGIQYNERFYAKLEDGYHYNTAYSNLRTNFWDTTILQLNTNKAQTVDMLIREYVDDRSTDMYAMNFDEPFIKIIIEHYLDPEDFKECYFVQRFIKTLREQYGTSQETYIYMALAYSSLTYHVYDALVFKFLDRDEFESDYDAIETFRQQQLATDLPINNFNDFQVVHDHLSVICQSLPEQTNNLYEGVIRLISGVASNDAPLCLEILAYFIQHTVMISINPGRIFYRLFQNTHAYNEQLFRLLKNSTFSQRQYWLERYFDCIPDELVTENSAEELLYSTFKASHSPIALKYVLRYEKARNNTIYNLLNNLYQRRENDNDFIYKIDDNFLTDFPALMDTHPEFVQELYLQQETINSHFDQAAKQFEIILAKFPGFFEKYLDFFIRKRGYSYYSRSKHFGGLWQWPNGRKLIYNAFVKIGKTELLYSAADLCATFFHPLPEESKLEALKMLDELVSHSFDQVPMLNLILNLVRNHLPNIYWDYVRKVIVSNSNVEIFKKLRFYNNHFTSSGNQIWDDFKAAQLGKVYEIVTALPNRLDYIDHRDWLSRKINDHKTYADQERRMIFRGLR